MSVCRMHLGVLFVCLLVTVIAQKSRMLPDYMDHPCNRKCQDDAEPMHCHYRFVAESYQTLSRACYSCTEGNVTDCLRQHCVTGNGVTRNIKTINRGIPGPTIQVCEGDTVEVRLENKMAMAEGLTVHWHGILQRGSPHMDGVGMITQCPVQAFSSFTYRFKASDPGTHFWHAHTGLQRGDGIFGSFVVRQPPNREPHSEVYDFDLPEHVIVVNDWQARSLLEVFTDYHHGEGSKDPQTILVNGHTRDSTGKLELPRAIFEVEEGKRYRFRLINAGALFCPVKISLDNHTLVLIAADGQPFVPYEIEALAIYSGERYDFVVKADQRPGQYLLRVEGLGDCDKVEELAVLNYTRPAEGEGASTDDMEAPRKAPTGRVFGVRPGMPIDPTGNEEDQILAMTSLAPDDRALTQEPDLQFVLDFKSNAVANLHYFDPDLYMPGETPYKKMRSAQINGISNTLGSVPLRSQMHQVPEDMFCNDDTIKRDCSKEWCECVHRLRAWRGAVVEVVLVSGGSDGFTHPVHLHGHAYRVVAIGRMDQKMTPALFRELDAAGNITRKLHRAPYKDTTPIPDGGYVVLRFVADNPGVWFMHCHLAMHAEIGMSLIMEVTEDGRLPPPPRDFPQCGPYPRSHFHDEDDSEANSTGLTNPAWLQVVGIIGCFALLVLTLTVALLAVKLRAARTAISRFGSYQYLVSTEEDIPATRCQQ